MCVCLRRFCVLESAFVRLLLILIICIVTCVQGNNVTGTFQLCHLLYALIEIMNLTIYAQVFIYIQTYIHTYIYCV